ncbi:MAG TPA: hypothetical protein VHN12_02395 [Geobacteraceae bacterium]|nr:hypothetical protein [Geobacteraceae bacterium]
MRNGIDTEYQVHTRPADEEKGAQKLGALPNRCSPQVTIAVS